MYRIEFKKIDLEAQDETIGEVVVQELFKDAVKTAYKIKGVIYQNGTEFESKERAEWFAKEFESLYSKWPDKYKVTTEVYRVS